MPLHSDLAGRDVADVLEERLESVRQSAGSDETAYAPRPPAVPIVSARGDFGTHRLGAVQFAESANGFGTLLAQAPLGVLLTQHRGSKFMYEAILGSSGLQQIGWTTPACAWSHEEGVGDFQCSFGIDGFRSFLWKNTEKIPYNISWESGDVIGCCIDATFPTNTKLIFYKNGMAVNTPEPINVYNPAAIASIVPGVSSSHRERILINLGTKPFLFVLPFFRFFLQTRSHSLMPSATGIRLKGLRQSRMAPATATDRRQGTWPNALSVCLS